MKNILIVMALALSTRVVAAQSPDVTARLREVLPADVATRVLARIDTARSRRLPAAALERQALRLTAKGASPRDVERAIDRKARHMEQAKVALEKGRGVRASDDEIDAGSEAIRRGVDGAKVSDLAKSAPSGRSMAVPLYVLGSLMDRGLPSDSALLRVRTRLASRVSDANMMRESARGDSISRTRRDRNDARRAGGERGRARDRGPDGTPGRGARPSSIPANAGSGNRPAAVGRPAGAGTRRGPNR